MNGSDRRVRKTKKALREGLARLMTEKNIRDISVRELTDLVDLNRATFYLHYRDIDDFLQRIEDEVITEISTILSQHLPQKEGDTPYPLLVALLTYITENQELCKMFFGNNSGRSFLDKLCAIVEERCLRNWLLNCLRFQASDEELSYFCSYVVYGYVAIIARWVQTGMHTPPEELAAMMNDIGRHGIGFLQHAKGARG